MLIFYAVECLSRFKEEVNTWGTVKKKKNGFVNS